MNAQAARDVGRAGRALPDEDQLEYATREGRVLITQDVHTFPALLERWRLQGRDHAGVLYTNQKSLREIYARLLAAQRRYESKDLINMDSWLPPPDELP